MAFMIDNNQFHCTTTDVWFGPRWHDVRDAEAFLLWLGETTGDPDPRRDDLDQKLIEWAMESGGMMTVESAVDRLVQEIPATILLAAAEHYLEKLDELL